MSGRRAVSVPMSTTSSLMLRGAQTGAVTPFRELVAAFFSGRGASSPSSPIDVEMLKLALLLPGRPAAIVQRIELDGLATVANPHAAAIPTTASFIKRLAKAPTTAAAVPSGTDILDVSGDDVLGYAPWQVVLCASEATAALIADEGVLSRVQARNADVFVAHRAIDAQRPAVRARAALHLAVPFSALYGRFSRALARPAGSGAADEQEEEEERGKPRPASALQRSSPGPAVGAWDAAMGRHQRIRGSGSRQPPGAAGGPATATAASSTAEQRQRSAVLFGSGRPGESHSPACAEFANFNNTVSLLPFSMECRLIGEGWSPSGADLDRIIAAARRRSHKLHQHRSLLSSEGDDHNLDVDETDGMPLHDETLWNLAASVRVATRLRDLLRATGSEHAARAPVALALPSSSSAATAASGGSSPTTSSFADGSSCDGLLAALAAQAAVATERLPAPSVLDRRTGANAVAALKRQADAAVSRFSLPGANAAAARGNNNGASAGHSRNNAGGGRRSGAPKFDM